MSVCAAHKIPNEWVSWLRYVGFHANHKKKKRGTNTSSTAHSSSQSRSALWCDRYLISTQGIRSNKIALCCCCSMSILTAVIYHSFFGRCSKSARSVRADSVASRLLLNFSLSPSLSLSQPLSIFISTQIMACYHRLLCLFLRFHENSFTRFSWYFDRARAPAHLYAYDVLEIRFPIWVSMWARVCMNAVTITRVHRHLCALTRKCPTWVQSQPFQMGLSSSSSSDRNVLVSNLTVGHDCTVIFPLSSPIQIIHFIECMCVLASQRAYVSNVRL